MSDEKLGRFQLVGGTALSLHLGHRISIDIDLFSQEIFEVDELKNYLEETYCFETIRISDITLIGSINSIKVDLIRYNYPLVESVTNFDGIRIYSIADIAAMKLIAMSQSGNRLKDFVDIAFLSMRMSVEDMLNAFKKKFPKTSVMTAVRGLTFFDDIDFSVQIDLISGKFKWKTVENRIKEMVKYSDKIFPPMNFL